mmetsp:Transcript_43687/g.85716  ORF Transcript_43687/g.85716 Transcript_43687/m.85716 type:complete len:115 (-) Transcript_43687:422-766(-)
MHGTFRQVQAVALGDERAGPDLECPAALKQKVMYLGALFESVGSYALDEGDVPGDAGIMEDAAAAAAVAAAAGAGMPHVEIDVEAVAAAAAAAAEIGSGVGQEVEGVGGGVMGI